MQVQGGIAPQTRVVRLGKKSGSFIFTFDTFFAADQMVVLYEGRPIFNTGCIARGDTDTGIDTPQSVVLSYSVQVIPDCTGLGSTVWSFSVSCP
jgi:hypothetical protein